MGCTETGGVACWVTTSLPQMVWYPLMTFKWISYCLGGCRLFFCCCSDVCVSWYPLHGSASSSLPLWIPMGLWFLFSLRVLWCINIIHFCWLNGFPVWPVGAPTRRFLRAAVVSALPYLLVYQGVLGFILEFLCPRPGPMYFSSELRYLETEVCVLGVFFKNVQNPGKVKIVNHLWKCLFC